MSACGCSFRETVQIFGAVEMSTAWGRPVKICVVERHRPSANVAIIFFVSTATYAGAAEICTFFVVVQTENISILFRH